MLWAHMFFEIRGWYAEKVYVTVRYQVFGEPVLRDGSRDPSFKSVCVVLVWSRPVELLFASLFQVQSGFYIDFVSLTGNNDV